MNPVYLRLLSQRPPAGFNRIDLVLSVIETLSPDDKCKLAARLPDEVTDYVLTEVDRGAEFYEDCLGSKAVIQDAPLF